MKLTTKLLTLAGILLLSTPVYSQDGASLFEAKCASCHVTTRPADISTLVAPPAMGVVRHVKMTYNTKESAVKFMVDYILNPDEKKAVCMADKIKRFGLMPSQKENVTSEEVQTIATWMYDSFGGQGMGQGKAHGKNCKNK